MIKVSHSATQMHSTMNRFCFPSPLSDGSLLCLLLSLSGARALRVLRRHNLLCFHEPGLSSRPSAQNGHSNSEFRQRETINT